MIDEFSNHVLFPLTAADPCPIHSPTTPSSRTDAVPTVTSPPMDDIEHPKESLAQLERRHERELSLLVEERKSALKNASKSEKKAIEAKMLQSEYDMKARHREELELLEEQIGKPSVVSVSKVNPLKRNMVTLGTVD